MSAAFAVFAKQTQPDSVASTQFKGTGGHPMSIPFCKTIEGRGLINSLATMTQL